MQTEARFLRSNGHESGGQDEAGPCRVRPRAAAQRLVTETRSETTQMIYCNKKNKIYR